MKDKTMKKRECPCCNTDIPIISFIKHMLAGKRGFSFVENEKGFICKACNNTILSAERKDNTMFYLLVLSWIPIGFLSLNDAAFISMENLMFLLKALSISITILTIGVLIYYYNTNFCCRDESSDQYNENSIHS